MPVRLTLDRALRIWALVACGYVFAMPVSHNAVLIPMVASLGAIAAYWFVRDRPSVHRSLLRPAILWLVLVLVGSITAALFHADGWLRVMVFMLGIPLFLMLLTSVFRREFIRPVMQLGAGVSIALAVIIVSQAAVAMGHLTFLKLPTPFFHLVGLRYVVDPAGPLRLTGVILPPVLWWGAMWIASLFAGRDDPYLPPLAVRGVAAALSVAAAVLSLRRGIIVALALTPLACLVIALILYARNHGERTVRLTLAGAVTAIGVFVGAVAIVLVIQPKSYEIVTASLGSVGASTAEQSSGGDASGASAGDGEGVHMFPDGTLTDTSGLDDKETSDSIRQLEIQALLHTENAREALVGRGLGASVDRGTHPRAEFEARPWQSELQYFLLFYWTGAVGIVLLVAVAVTGGLALRRAMRHAGDLNAVLFVTSAGAVALLVANATNPYMQALGHVWPLFLPFMIAQVALARPSLVSAAGQRRAGGSDVASSTNEVN